MKIDFDQEDLCEMAAVITKEVLREIRPLLDRAPAADEVVYDVQGLADYLKTTPKWVYNHIHELPHFRKGGLLRFKKAAMDKLFEENPLKLPA